METPGVRVAAFDELDAVTAYRLLKLRADVFVVEQACVYPDLDGRDLEPSTRHLWVEAGGEPIAYLRMLDDDGVLRIGRVCVAADHRGSGLAGVLMAAAIEQVGARESVLDAQSQVARWYERYGYAVTGPEFLDDGIPHIPMARPSHR